MKIDELLDIKQKIENWSGFPLAVDKNSTEEEWQSGIDTLIYQLSNEVFDRGTNYMNEVKRALANELTNEFKI